LTLAYVSGRTARPLEPLCEIAQLGFVFDANVRDRYLDDVEALGDPGDPFVASNARQPWATASYNVAAVTSTVRETPSVS
jgi:hypothetical protein